MHLGVYDVMTPPYTHEYAITIHKHQVKDYVDSKQIKSVMQILEKRTAGHFISGYHEISSKYNQLHFHGVFGCHRKVHFSINSSINGFRIYWKPIHNRLGWLSYITKATNNIYEDEQVCISNYYLHNYGFL